MNIKRLEDLPITINPLELCTCNKTIRPACDQALKNFFHTFSFQLPFLSVNNIIKFRILTYKVVNENNEKLFNHEIIILCCIIPLCALQKTLKN